MTHNRMLVHLSVLCGRREYQPVDARQRVCGGGLTRLTLDTPPPRPNNGGQPATGHGII